MGPPHPEQRKSPHLSCRTKVHLWWVWDFPTSFLQREGVHVVSWPRSTTTDWKSGKPEARQVSPTSQEARPKGLPLLFTERPDPFRDPGPWVGYCNWMGVHVLSLLGQVWASYIMWKEKESSLVTIRVASGRDKALTWLPCFSFLLGSSKRRFPFSCIWVRSDQCNMGRNDASLCWLVLFKETTNASTHTSLFLPFCADLRGHDMGTAVS